MLARCVNQCKQLARLLLGVGMIITAEAAAQGVLHVYGPPGPSPAIEQAALLFGSRNAIRVEVVSGPVGEWIDRAKLNADLIFTDAAFAMTDLLRAEDLAVDEVSVAPLYVRPPVTLVRPGNPKKVRDFAGILKRDMGVMSKPC